MAAEYSVRRVDASTISMDDCRIRPTVHFVAQHADGQVAWRTVSYYADVSPRSIAGLRLQAANACKRLEAHLTRTGERWEVIEAARAKAERDAKKRAQRLAWLRKNVPLLAAELADMESAAK